VRVEFDGYAHDYTVHGELDLETERLQDLLDQSTEFEITRASVRALDDGRTHDLEAATIPRDELCMVVGAGPRGAPARRFRTRPYPIRAHVGPYAAVGYLHALPTADPRTTALRRSVIALSPARVEYVAAGERVEEQHDVLLLVKANMTRFESASDEDVGLGQHPEFSVTVDPHAKDLTGEVTRQDLDE
jgi:hypothetical protein